MDERALLEAAEASTGLGDWGDDDSFRVGLRVFVDAVEATNPSLPARQVAQFQIVHWLSQRLHLVDDARQHPEILEVPVERPVVVIGLPRTGTTIVHELLAIDPAARAPLEWEITAVWPAPEVATFDTDPRIAACDALFAGLAQAAPELPAILPLGAKLPAECNRMMMYHFAGPDFWAMFGVPRFLRWVAEERAPGVYRTHRRILQQLSWKGPRGRWTLKSPAHLFDLEGLLEEYPDACLVWTHRNPLAALASLASLIVTMQRANGGDPDPRVIGEEALEAFGTALERGTASRQASPRLDGAIMDVAYRDVLEDPVGVMREIHERFGLAFGDGHADRIRRFLAENPQDKHGRHSYRPEDFGLDLDTVRARFPRYFERFGGLLDL
ncbi:MAG: sulfotransferase family protein [Candidatus Binatia bacterium]